MTVFLTFECSNLLAALLLRGAVLLGVEYLGPVRAGEALEDDFAFALGF